MSWKESSYGRTDAFCDSAQRRGEHDLVVPRVGISRKTGYKILERFEHCGVEGLSDRTRPAASLCQPNARTSGSCHRGSQTRKTSLGSAQDLRTAAASIACAREGASSQHHSCHYGSTRSGGKGQPEQDTCRGNSAFSWPVSIELSTVVVVDGAEHRSGWKFAQFGGKARSGLLLD